MTTTAYFCAYTGKQVTGDFCPDCNRMDCAEERTLPATHSSFCQDNLPAVVELLLPDNCPTCAAYRAGRVDAADALTEIKDSAFNSRAWLPRGEAINAARGEF